MRVETVNVGRVRRHPDIARRHPLLYHVAEAGAWPALRRHGLLSTSALLDRFEVRSDERRVIESERRTDAVRLWHPEHGAAVIRDNKPLRAELMASSLDGMSLDEWLRTLNARVFFWAERERAERLVRARAHRERAHDVLVVETSQLLARHRERVAVAHINTGTALFPGAARRGRGTFKRLDELESGTRVVEVTVDYAVPDIEAITARVERWGAGQPAKVIWSR